MKKIIIAIAIACITAVLSLTYTGCTENPEDKGGAAGTVQSSAETEQSTAEHTTDSSGTTTQSPESTASTAVSSASAAKPTVSSVPAKAAPGTTTTISSAVTVTSTPQTTVITDWTPFEQARVVELVNEERAKHGLPELKNDYSRLQQAATKRAAELRTKFSHTRPDSTSWSTVLNEFVINPSAAGENIASGQSTPEAVFEAWMSSEGHRKNMLSTSYSHIAVGKNGTSWVQIFVRV